MRGIFVFTNAVFWLGAVSLLGGCGQGDERLKERAGIEGEISAQKAIEVENLNRSARAKEMEDDLQRRHRFYQALKGIYEGQFTDETGGRWNIRFTFVPSLPPYKTDRVRAIEEIVADINNLYLNVQVVQWSSTQSSAAGCKSENIRPDIERGEISIATSSCPVLYTLSLAIEGEQAAPVDAGVRSTEVARRLLNGQQGSVAVIVGNGASVTHPEPFRFSVRRLEQKEDQ